MAHKKREILIWFFVNLFIVLFCFLSLVLFYQQLPPSKQTELIQIIYPFRFYLILPLLILISGIIFFTKWILEELWFPIQQLKEEVQLISTSNPSYRTTPQGNRLVKSMALAINHYSEKMETIVDQVQDQITVAKGELEREKNLLGILIEELREGVIVCNKKGEILLYNQSAKQLFSPPGDQKKDDQAAFIGLGRSIFQVLDTPLLKYTLNELQDHQQSGSKNLQQHFIMRFEEELLEIETVGILDNTHELNGFIFVIRQISAKTDNFNHYGRIIQNFKEKFRGPLANVRSSVETVTDYPTMTREEKNVMLDIVKKNAIHLSDILEHSFSQPFRGAHTASFLEEVSVQEWLISLQRRIEKELQVTLSLELDPTDCLTPMKRYFMTQAIIQLLGQLKFVLQSHSFQCKLQQQDQFAVIDILWLGRGLEPELFQEWIVEPLQWETEDIPISISEIFQYHDAEIWLQSEIESDHHYIRLFLTKTTPLTESFKRDKHITLTSRPVFYDFNLFEKTVEYGELENIPLSELSYTVFDTETTGLNPSDGDEIISIGAVRIVNMRMLENETFETLVDPKRNVPSSSIAVHGIHPEKLAGKPTIEQVLPRFRGFTENTVLIAHNAAFDLKFLQLKEQSSGVRFTNPVLDTLLLSAVVHPNQDSHSLDEVARRLNIPVRDRHTALGDALVTAEVFLKLIPLLREKGIQTLREAIETSQKTYYARLHY